MVHFRLYSEKVFISRIMAPITINSRICRYFLTLITINKKFWVFSIFKVLGPSIILRNFLPISPTTHCVGGWKFWDWANFWWKIIWPIFFSKFENFTLFWNKVWNLSIHLVHFISWKRSSNPNHFRFGWTRTSKKCLTVFWNILYYIMGWTNVKSVII